MFTRHIHVHICVYVQCTSMRFNIIKSEEILLANSLLESQFL